MLLKLANVSKAFGDIVALDHVSFEIEDGEYICVLGPTGAGKTTLLRVIAGLLEPDEGDLYVQETRVNKVPPEERNAVYMFQQFALFPHMNVWQNVSFGPSMRGLNMATVKGVSEEVLNMVRLAARWDAFPNELSGGMQQRVALARGISSGARVLLLDEPFGALDARLRVELRFQLRKLVKDQGLTAVHVTHDQEEALTISDRVFVLRNGRIQQIGKPYEVYARPNSIFVASFVGGANFLEGIMVEAGKSGSIVELLDGSRVHVSNTMENIGEHIVVAVRRENTMISVQEFELNNIGGYIESVRFMGSLIEYGVKLKNDVLVSSKMLTSSKHRAFEVGEKANISFLPEHSFVFHYPETSLQKEIEAI